MPETTSHQNASGSGSRPGADSADANNAPANTETSSSTYKPPSKYRFIKDNWGNRIMFQLSHGLKFDPDDFEEGDLILEGYLECERAEHEHQASKAEKVYRPCPLSFLGMVS